MLKIKDSVDLKELEKFGFSETKNTFFKKATLQEATSIHKDANDIYLTYNNGRSYYLNIDVLYDLIKADLVEKVED